MASTSDGRGPIWRAAKWSARPLTSGAATAGRGSGGVTTEVIGVSRSCLGPRGGTAGGQTPREAGSRGVSSSWSDLPPALLADVLAIGRGVQQSLELVGVREPELDHPPGAVRVAIHCGRVGVERGVDVQHLAGERGIEFGHRLDRFED